jgi:hypothetical protein
MTNELLKPLIEQPWYIVIYTFEDRDEKGDSFFRDEYSVSTSPFTEKEKRGYTICQFPTFWGVGVDSEVMQCGIAERVIKDHNDSILLRIENAMLKERIEELENEVAEKEIKGA